MLHVVSGGVTLRNLRIEQTGDESGQGLALKVDHPDVELDRVTVRGAVFGLKAEEGVWRYPHQLNLGTVAPDATHRIRLRVVVPVPCKLTSEVSGVKVRPRSLTPGRHEVVVEIEAMRADTLVSGTLTIETAFLRREIVLNAHALAPAVGLATPAKSERLIWQPEDWETPTIETPPPTHEMTPKIPKPNLPVRSTLRSVKGPLLGSLFSSPLVGTTPPKAEPTPETAAIMTMIPDPPPTVIKKHKPPITLPSWAKGTGTESPPVS